MNTIQFFGAIELGILYSLVALGVYLTFRVINFPDLTVDGSFPLGAAITAILLTNNVNPMMTTAAAICAGIIAGVITGYLHVRCKILGLLAGILTMTAMYSINLRIMGKPNISVMNAPTIFDYWQPLANLNSFNHHSTLIILLSMVLFCCVLLYYFLHSQVGLALRAIGANPRVSPAYGINVNTMTLTGLAISNGIIALAGSLFTQAYGFADVAMGTGTLITGLAAIIIGENLFPQNKIWCFIFSCIVGSIIYRLAIACALNAKLPIIQAADLNLITAIVVILAMLLPRWLTKVNTPLWRKLL